MTPIRELPHKWLRAAREFGAEAELNRGNFGEYADDIAGFGGWKTWFDMPPKEQGEARAEFKNGREEERAAQ